MAGGDTPDFYDTVTPDITRWAPGTDFGSTDWDGVIPALTSQVISWVPDDDGFMYVFDSAFFDSYIIGDTYWAVSMYPNGYPGTMVWLACGHCYGSTVIKPFSFVSCALAYPSQIDVTIYNSNIYARYLRLVITCYRYFRG